MWPCVLVLLPAPSRDVGGPSRAGLARARGIPPAPSVTRFANIPARIGAVLHIGRRGLSDNVVVLVLLQWMTSAKPTAPRRPRKPRNTAPIALPERNSTAKSDRSVTISVAPDKVLETDPRPHVRMPPKLKRESADAYARFISYAMPAEGETRSFASVARQCGVDPTSVSEMARRFEWRSRCTTFERAKVESAALVAGTLAAEAGRDSLALCRALREQIANIVAEVEEGGVTAEEVLQSGLDASKILERLVKTERLILGLSTQNQSVVVRDERAETPNYSKMTSTELEVCNLAGHIEDAYLHHGGRVQNGYYRQRVEAMNASSARRPLPEVSP